jgi:uncharacterized protein
VADRRCVLLYTKPSRPGRVKTRLIGALDAQQVAKLHEAFVGDLTERLSGGSFELRIAWALDPGEVPPESPLPAFRQEGEGLGERLFRGLTAAAAECRWIAAVGSDHPDLPLARVEEAFARLESGAEVVLGPAEDGGYYLIAVAGEALRPALFEKIPWSTAEVLATTLERCRSEALRVELLALGRDVDTPRDLERLSRELATSTEHCPRTLALLAGWNRLAAH